MKAKLLIINFLVVALFSGYSFAQKINVAKLDSVFQTLEANNKFMGSIAISQNGQLIYSRAIGYADIETLKRASPESKYRIGSISKMFTSALVFKAIDENKLTLDKTIDAFFPSIENARKITIGNLLNHRSGIHNFTDNPDYLKWNTLPKSEKELVEIITNGKSDFEPNSKGQYSNSNYVLLTIILEKIYNKPYKTLVEKYITKPLRLKNTYLGNKINLSDNECYSYKFDDKWVKESETDMSIPLGAGAIVSNPSDLALFIYDLFSGKIISEKSLRQMTTIEDNYGKGIFRFPFYEKVLYGHTGGIDRFTSTLSFLPEDKISVALTSNGSNFSNNTIMIFALSCLYDKPFEIPSFKVINLTSEDLDKYLGIYSSIQIPLKITFTKSGNKLIAQATGQSSLSLNASDKNIFKSADGSIVIEFKPEIMQMTLKQGGANFVFTKE